MAMTAAFAPLGNGITGVDPSVTVAATASSTASTIFAGSTQQAQSFTQVRVCNTTAVWAYINFGVLNSVAAATVASSIPIAPGSVEVFTIDPTSNAATVILASGTGNVIFTRGEGI
jgi:hypothetical protein